jgi:hypothetical protein
MPSRIRRKSSKKTSAKKINQRKSDRKKSVLHLLLCAWMKPLKKRITYFINVSLNPFHIYFQSGKLSFVKKVEIVVPYYIFI